MSTSWSWEDEQRLRSVVQVPDEVETQEYLTLILLGRPAIPAITLKDIGWGLVVVGMCFASAALVVGVLSLLVHIAHKII